MEFPCFGRTKRKEKIDYSFTPNKVPKVNEREQHHGEGWMFSTHLNVLVIYLISTLLPHNGMKQTLFIVGCMQLCATPFVTRSHVRTNDFPILQAFVDSQKYIFLFSYIYIFLVDFFCEFFNFLCKGTLYNYRYISSIYMYWTYIHV
jgi:hypothetical protein